MKAKFLVSAALGAGKKKSGVEQVVTPMLMLAKFSGMNLSADLEGLVESTDGLIQDKLAASGFKGSAGESLTIKLAPGSKQKHVLFVGLGKAGRFDCGTVRDTIKLAVDNAVATGSERLSIPIMPNRLTSTSMGLMPTAHIIKCVADDVLAEKKGDGTLEIELITSPHGKRHVEAGVKKARKKSGSRPCGVCDDVKPKGETKPKAASTPAAKSDAKAGGAKKVACGK